MESTIGSSSGFGQSSQGGKQAAVKPPLYVPSKRQPSEGPRRGTDYQRGLSNGPSAATADANGYVAKTGFSSLALGPSLTSSHQGSSSIDRAGNRGAAYDKSAFPSQFGHGSGAPRRSSKGPSQGSGLFGGANQGLTPPPVAKTHVGGYVA